LEAAYSLNDRAFVENLGTILLYAVLVNYLDNFVKFPFSRVLYWTSASLAAS